MLAVTLYFDGEPVLRLTVFSLDVTCGPDGAVTLRFMPAHDDEDAVITYHNVTHVHVEPATLPAS
jgi:hypothetical protein